MDTDGGRPEQGLSHTEAKLSLDLRQLDSEQIEMLGLHICPDTSVSPLFDLRSALLGISTNVRHEAIEHE
jgi:hypothetical protein